MQISKHFFVAIVIIVSLSVAVSRCKSPTAAKEEPVAAVQDTIVKMDTAQTVVKDTIAVKAAHTPLTLIIKNLESADAPIIVGLYGTDNKFPDPKDQMKEYHFKPHGKEHVAKITDLKFGVYAMAIYQDVNSNGKIDKNLIGVPTEPYAFSNNYKPTVKAPAFKNCKFDYDSKSNTVTMTMIK